MAKHLVIAGHGQGVYQYDPGCGVPGYTEADYVRRFVSAMRKYDGGQIDYITDKNVYDWDSKGYGVFDAIAASGYETVTELHVDAATSTAAEDAHVIILQGYEPDALDYRIRDVLTKHVGAQRGDWNYDGVLDGIAGRDNLWNVNRAAQMGLNYRLVELGFMTNAAERAYLYANINAYAKDIAEAITGLAQEVETPTTETKRETVRVSLHGYAREVQGRNMDGRVYVAVSDLLPQMGYEVGWENGVVTIGYKK